MVGDRSRGPSGDPPAALLSTQRYQAEINDLENLGEMGSGTCGQVWKMRFRKTGHIIAVKVSLPHPSSRMYPVPLQPAQHLKLPSWLSLLAANAALGEQGGE